MKSLIKNNNELILQKSEDKIILELSRRVVHDLRSPITLIRKGLDSNIAETNLLVQAVDSIENICNDLLLHTREGRVPITRRRNRKLNLHRFLKDAVDQKHAELNRQFITIDMRQEDIFLWVNPTFLSTCFSNILNNSFEANNMNPLVHIIVQQIDFQTSIQFSDNGPGFSAEFLEKFRANIAFSSKPEGNAIGLSSAVEYMNSIGGDIECFNAIGATVRLTFPKSSFASRTDKIILVEDDKYVASEWIQKAGQLNLQLKWFKNWNELSHQIGGISKNSEFFIDSSLSDVISGEEIAKKSFEQDYNRLNICSNFPEDKFNEFDFLNSIINKKFPYKEI